MGFNILRDAKEMFEMIQSARVGLESGNQPFVAHAAMWARNGKPAVEFDAARTQFTLRGVEQQAGFRQCDGFIQVAKLVMGPRSIRQNLRLRGGKPTRVRGLM